MEDGCEVTFIVKKAIQDYAKRKNVQVGSDFYGAIYTPNASFEMKNSANIYGSIVAKSYEQKNSATFNYDASLQEVTTEDAAICFVVDKCKYWR